MIYIPFRYHYKYSTRRTLCREDLPRCGQLCSSFCPILTEMRTYLDCGLLRRCTHSNRCCIRSRRHRSSPPQTGERGSPLKSEVRLNEYQSGITRQKTKKSGQQDANNQMNRMTQILNF